MLMERTDTHRKPTTERWTCRSCGGMLGEIHGSTVTVRLSVRHGNQGVREINFSSKEPCSQRCDRCGALNVRGG